MEIVMLTNPDDAMLVKQAPRTVWFNAFESEQPRAISFRDTEKQSRDKGELAGVGMGVAGMDIDMHSAEPKSSGGQWLGWLEQHCACL